MNRQDIIRMARDADIKFKTDVFRSDFCDGVYEDDFERFASLIASAEREACEDLHDHKDVMAPIGHSAWGEAYQEGWIDGVKAYQEAIRARAHVYANDTLSERVDIKGENKHD